MKNIRCSEILAKVDNLKPNMYSQSLKRSWLNSAEIKIREFMAMYNNSLFDDSFIEEENPYLTLKEDKSDLYVYYVMAMIDLSNQDITLYNNNVIIFTDMLEDFKKQYRREHTPQKNTSTTL